MRFTIALDGTALCCEMDLWIDDNMDRERILATEQDTVLLIEDGRERQRAVMFDGLFGGAHKMCRQVTQDLGSVERHGHLDEQMRDVYQGLHQGLPLAATLTSPQAQESMFKHC